MDGLNSLLIVASAFSVFCQYIDTTHKNDMQTIKDNLRKLSFDEGEKNEGATGVKEDWDDVMNFDCLRAKNFVITLFCYLAFIVIFVACNSFFLAIVFEMPTNWSHYIVGVLGVVLFVIFCKASFRVKGMWDEQANLADRAREIERLHKAVATSIAFERKVSIFGCKSLPTYHHTCIYS